MLRLLLLCLVVSFLSGCMCPPVEEIAIDPTLEPIEQEIALEAIEEWFQEVPEARVPVFIGADRGRGALISAPKKVCKKKTRVGDTDLSQPGSAPVVRICFEKLSERNLRLTVLHEMGHALARRGKHLEPGNVMTRKGDCAPEHLTAEDREYVISRLE